MKEFQALPGSKTAGMDFPESHAEDMMESMYEKRPWLRSYPDWVAPRPGDESATAIDDFNQAVLSGPDRPAVCYFDHALSYGEINRLSDALAAAFREFGLRENGSNHCRSSERTPAPRRYVCRMETGHSRGPGQSHVQRAGTLVFFPGFRCETLSDPRRNCRLSRSIVLEEHEGRAGRYDFGPGYASR